MQPRDLVHRLSFRAREAVTVSPPAWKRLARLSEVEAGLAAGISAFVSKSEDIDAICGRIAELVAARR